MGLCGRQKTYNYAHFIPKTLQLADNSAETGSGVQRRQAQGFSKVRNVNASNRKGQGLGGGGGLGGRPIKEGQAC